MVGRKERDDGTRAVARSRPRAAATVMAVIRGAIMNFFLAGKGRLAKAKRVEKGE